MWQIHEICRRFIYNKSQAKIFTYSPGMIKCQYKLSNSDTTYPFCIQSAVCSNINMNTCNISVCQLHENEMQCRPKTVCWRKLWNIMEQKKSCEPRRAGGREIRAWTAVQSPPTSTLFPCMKNCCVRNLWTRSLCFF